jgi:hypothetical protein
VGRREHPPADKLVDGMSPPRRFVGVLAGSGVPWSTRASLRASEWRRPLPARDVPRVLRQRLALVASSATDKTTCRDPPRRAPA